LVRPTTGATVSRCRTLSPLRATTAEAALGNGSQDHE
jgi:hypothetical protein